MRAIVACFFVCLCVTLAVTSSQAQVERRNPSARPGDERYTPTKLQWAALELQTESGNTIVTSDVPLTITYIPRDDGRTVTCLLQYMPDANAEVVKLYREMSHNSFTSYVERTGWKWLRLDYQERVTHLQKQ